MSTQKAEGPRGGGGGGGRLKSAAHPTPTELLALPELPRPACTYADHSYPAYTAKQMEAYARDALTTLSAREDGWIACSDRLPNTEDDVICGCELSGEVAMGYRRKDRPSGPHMWSYADDHDWFVDVTHWQPVPTMAPKAPTAGEGQRLGDDPLLQSMANTSYKKGQPT